MIIADTDVLIDYLADRQPFAERIALELERGALATTAISRFELLSGAKGSSQEQSIRELLDALSTLPVDAEAADQAAALRRQLEAEGKVIGMADSLIAGVVLRHNALLLTRNRRHFERVKGLHLSGTGTMPRERK